MDNDFLRIEGIQQHIEDANYKELTNTAVIFDEIVNLNAWKSFVGKKMSEYKRELNKKKVNAYHNLIFSQRANGYEIAPSIAKDYIASKCGDLQYYFDFADRVNSNCAYYIDSLRTILSTLKQEMATNIYQPA